MSEQNNDVRVRNAYENQQPTNNQQENNQNQGFGFGSIWKYILVYLVINMVINMFRSPPEMKREDFIDKHGNRVIMKDKLQNIFYTWF